MDNIFPFLFWFRKQKMYKVNTDTMELLRVQNQDQKKHP